MNGNKILIVSVIALILSLKGSAIVLDFSHPRPWIGLVMQILGQMLGVFVLVSIVIKFV